MLKFKKYQEGGVAPAPAAAAPAQQDPILQLAEMFAQGLQTGDCDILAQGAQMFLEMISQSSAQGPVDQVPAGEPVFRQGGKLIRRK